MKIKSVTLNNFISYCNMEYTFENKGLALIYGPTGSGKSTLCDAIPWIAYGITAKNGNADDVLSWTATEPTTGLLETDRYTIFRSRGFKQNDLYYRIGAGPIIRGKDMKDTQQQINEILGIDAQTYVATAYYHEFSSTASFFTATAIERRRLFDNLIDLSLAVTLDKNTKLKAKQIRSVIDLREDQLTEIKATINEIEKTNTRNKQKFTDWQNDWEDVKAELEENIKNEKALNEEKHKAAAEEIDGYLLETDRFTTALLVTTDELKNTPKGACASCGAPLNYKKVKELETKINDIKLQLSRLDTKIIQAQGKAQNIIADNWRGLLKEHLKKKNPYNIETTEQTRLNDLTAQYSATSKELTELEVELTDLSIIEDVTAEYRRVKILNTISHIQDTTNELIANYFDAEFRVEFEVKVADKLDVIITKNGYNAPFTQLSKGQRQLLKLCFGTAVIKTLRKAQAAPNVLFYDEALDGMDDDFKAKAFALYSNLQQEVASIFIVEHSSNFQERFENKYKVTMIEGNSQIEKA